MWLCTVGSGLWASCQIKVQTADKTLHLHCESGKTLAEQELNFETLPQDAAGCRRGGGFVRKWGIPHLSPFTYGNLEGNIMINQEILGYPGVPNVQRNTCAMQHFRVP